MSVLEPSFSVHFSFPVVFTRGLWQPHSPLFADIVGRLEPGRQHRLLVAVDDGLAAASSSLIQDITAYVEAHAGQLALVAPPVLVPGGEASKNDLSQTLRILELINTHGIDRQSFIVAIGGGAALDTISFAAATGHRGIRVIRIPSTVLAQCDSGVAVKNGVNMFGKKNFVGTFAPPFAVINDLDLIETLSRRDRIAGVSEMIKVALLKDAGLFDQIERSAALLHAGDIDALGAVIRPSLEWHMRHICTTGDPFEMGSARPLDFGHWAAHKLESITGNRIRHGEAVSIGMALDIRYATLSGFLPTKIATRIAAVISATGLPTWDEAVLQRNASGELLLIEGLREFREHLGGELHITMLRDIQSPFEVTEMDLALVTQAITDLAPVH